MLCHVGGACGQHHPDNSTRCGFCSPTNPFLLLSAPLLPQSASCDLASHLELASLSCYVKVLFSFSNLDRVIPGSPVWSLKCILSFALLLHGNTMQEFILSL